MVEENRTFADEISVIAKHEISKLPTNQACTIIGNYENDNEHVDVKLANGEVFKYVNIVGNNSVGENGLLCFLNGDITKCLVVSSNNIINEENTILALGLGLFTIKSDGHLWVELPVGIENPFEIDANGHLIVTLPEGASNDYEIEDKNLIYHRGE